MQLYALDDQKKVIFAECAIKQKDYFCLECGSIVHIRSGMHRRIHFYHLAPNSHCSQSGKSMVHLQTQWHLFKLLPEGDCFLEYRFNEVNRIADVVWISRKLIFEIQCSPISAKEIEDRNQDYAKVGYQVIWVLHQQCFNQWRVSSAEHFLRGTPTYFTNMNQEGVGYIYDQLDHIHKGMRKMLISSLEIDLSQVHSLPKELSLATYPQSIQKRLNIWPFFFNGDVIFHILSAEKDSLFCRQIDKLALEENEGKTIQRKYSLWIHLIRLFKSSVYRFYRNVFQIILEKSAQ